METQNPAAANLSRQATLFDLNGGPSRKVSYSTNPNHTVPALVIEKPAPSVASNNSMNSASTLVEGGSPTVLLTPALASDSFSKPPTEPHSPGTQPGRLHRNETLVTEHGFLESDWTQRATTVAAPLGHRSTVETAAQIRAALVATLAPELQALPAIVSTVQYGETDMDISADSALDPTAAATLARQRAGSLCAANGLLPKMTAAQQAALLAKSMQESVVQAGCSQSGSPTVQTAFTSAPACAILPVGITVSPVVPIISLSDVSVLTDPAMVRQQAHQTLAEILNRWHLQRLACIQGVYNFVYSSPRVACEILQHDEARSVLKLFEWDLDGNVKATLASIQDRLLKEGPSNGPSELESANASGLYQQLSLCVAEKLNFVRQLVAYTTSAGQHQLDALKESPVGYYLLPLLFDTVQGIPEVACRILLQAGRFRDDRGQVIEGADGGAQIADHVQQHWLARLRNEMWEERMRVAGASTEMSRSASSVGLGLGVDSYGQGNQQPQGMPRSSSILAAHLSGLGSPPSIFVDPKILFSDGSDHSDAPQPFRVFRTPNATMPPTPLLGMAFLPAADNMPTIQGNSGYLGGQQSSSLFPEGSMTPSAMFDTGDDPSSGDLGSGMMNWEMYDGPSRSLSPAPQDNRQQGQQNNQPQRDRPEDDPPQPPPFEPMITDTSRRTMNSLSSATILRFSIPNGFETASSIAPLPKKESKKKKAEDDGPAKYIERKMSVDSAEIEEFSEVESDQDSMMDDGRGHHDSVFSSDESDREEQGDYYGYAGSSSGRPGKITKKAKKSYNSGSTSGMPSSVAGTGSPVEKPKAPRPAKPSTASVKVLKKCEWCLVNHSPEWRKGPTGEKTLCNACGLKFARSKKSVAHYREFYAASNPPPFAPDDE